MRRFKAEGVWRAFSELASEGLFARRRRRAGAARLRRPRLRRDRQRLAHAERISPSPSSTATATSSASAASCRTTPSQLEDLPDNLVKAVLATEDRRFFEHFGIDVFGTFRAVQENARAGGVVQGGSSITQQLAKNLFLSNERTLQRKIKEAYLALWLEANLSKREILKLYLDRAYMGGGTFGVGAAADFYFGKKVQDLDLAESAHARRPVQGADQIRAAHQPAGRARPRQRGADQHGAGGLHDGGPGGRRAPPARPSPSSARRSPPPTISSTGRSSR